MEDWDDLASVRLYHFIVQVMQTKQKNGCLCFMKHLRLHLCKAKQHIYIWISFYLASICLVHVVVFHFHNFGRQHITQILHLWKCHLRQCFWRVYYYTPRKRIFFWGGGGGGIKRSPCLSFCLFVHLSVQSKLNLGHNFWTKRDQAFILHMCITCGKIFLLIPKILTSWPWLLTYFWKNLTLAITFEPRDIGLSYYTVCVLLVARPFCWYQQTLIFNFYLILKKKLNLGHNLWTERDSAFILGIDIPYGKTFLSIPKLLIPWPWPSTLT